MFIEEARKYSEPGDKSNADAVLQVTTNINQELFKKIRGDKDMCEALRELMADDLEEAEKKGTDKHIVEMVCKKIAKG